MRERVWADKEVRGLEIRAWESGGSQFGDNQMAVLTPSQATKSLPWEVRQEREKRRHSGESSLFLLDSPGSANLLLQLQGYFHIYTQCTICYFPAWFIMKPPYMLEQLKSLHFTLEMKLWWPGSQSFRQLLSLIQPVWVTVGGCGHPHLQLLVIRALLLASAWPGKWGVTSKWLMNKCSGGNQRNVTYTLLWGMSKWGPITSIPITPEEFEYVWRSLPSSLPLYYLTVGGKKKSGILSLNCSFWIKKVESLSQFSHVNLKVNVYIQMINSYRKVWGREGIKTLMMINLQIGG